MLILSAAATGGGGYALVNSASGGAGAAAPTLTCDMQSAPGPADLLVGVYGSGYSPQTISDSLNGNWTALGLIASQQGGTSFCLCYFARPAVSTTMTFTIAGSNPYNCYLAVAGFKGSAATPYDTQNHYTYPAGSGGISSISSGAVTATAGELLVAGIGAAANPNGTVGITPAGFTILQQISGTTNIGGIGLAWMTAIAGSNNSTWSLSAAPPGPVAQLASFK